MSTNALDTRTACVIATAALAELGVGRAAVYGVAGSDTAQIHRAAVGDVTATGLDGKPLTERWEVDFVTLSNPNGISVTIDKKTGESRVGVAREMNVFFWACRKHPINPAYLAFCSDTSDTPRER